MSIIGEVKAAGWLHTEGFAAIIVIMHACPGLQLHPPAAASRFVVLPAALLLIASAARVGRRFQGNHPPPTTGSAGLLLPLSLANDLRC